jgi:hypothetical protein
MVLSLLLSVALAGWQATADDIVKREQQRVEYLTTGQLDRLAAMLSPTLSYTHSSGAIDGKDAFMASLRSGQVAYKALRHQDVQVRFPAPDVAVINGMSDVDVVIAGKPQTIPLRFTMVYVRKDGQWLLEVWQSTRRAQ